MKLRSCILALMTIALSPIGASALDVGESEFAWVSELADAGYQPFAVSGTDRASFGMMKDSDMYLCFLVDDDDRRTARRDVLIASMQDNSASRAMPNIPVACMLTQ